jgi:molybdate transport system regulatory protein
MTRVSLRFEFGPHLQIGHGKVRLLELIDELGSISAAGRAMGMSYRRAWLLVDSLNQGFLTPAVETQMGGSKGGGASLTPFGHELVAQFRAMERAARRAVEPRLARLEQQLAPQPRPPSEEAPPRDDDHDEF